MIFFERFFKNEKFIEALSTPSRKNIYQKFLLAHKIHMDHHLVNKNFSDESTQTWSYPLIRM